MLKCTMFKPHEQGALLGFANILVEKWGVTLQGCKLFSQNGKRWVALPSVPYEKDGVKKYSECIRFENKEHKEKFCDMIKLAIDEFKCQNPEQQ